MKAKQTYLRQKERFKCEREAVGRTRALPMRAKVKDWREAVERVDIIVCSCRTVEDGGEGLRRKRV